ncbi:MAG: proliferating cell nuclear antigen (pcna) [Candidatus Thorarchaeota archaeon]
MFKATLDSTKMWKQIVDALTTLLTEAHFVASSDGIALRQMDSSRAAMIDLMLPASVFQEYMCDRERQICLGVDELAKISKRLGGDDRLEFVIEDADAEKFQIRTLGQADRIFRLRMLTPPDSVPRRPSTELDVRAEMYAEGFKQAIRDVGVFSSHVRISANNEAIILAGEGDSGEAEVVLKLGDESALFDLKVKNSATSMYALSYLSEISRSVSGDTVILQFSTNKPITLDFNLAEGSRVGFILAPRVQRR